MDLLVQTILSQNTTDRNRDQAYRKLRRRFPTWQQVLAAPAKQVAEAIRPAGLHRQRAARIQAVLARLAEERGELSLTFLEQLADQQAAQWLLSLPGVGRKTAYVVLLFAFGRPLFPVDTHVARVSRRLGLIGQGGDPHAALGPQVPAGRQLEVHLNLIRLGRTVCRAGRPRCAHCPLPDLCRQVASKLSPALRPLLRGGPPTAALVRRAGGRTAAATVDRHRLLELVADPGVEFLEPASKLSPKEAT
ncbi:MAG: endonuclease III domain-containing protein [Candidatus Bipolaricaulaceae bacterium]